MARTIPESVAGADLFVPDAYDFFSVGAGEMPNGDDCLVINPSAAASCDPRAFVSSPTLSPPVMTSGSHGAHAISFWFKNNTAGSGAGKFTFGVQTAAATTSGSADNPWGIGVTWSSTSIGTTGVNYFQRTASGTFTLSTGSLNGNANWIFVLFNISAIGASTSSTYMSAANATPPVALTVPGSSRVSAATWNANQRFFIGRYSDTGDQANMPNRSFRVGKITIHDHMLDITEAQMLFYSMTV